MSGDCGGTVIITGALPVRGGNASPLFGGPLFTGWRGSENAGMKLQRRGQVLGKIIPGVAAGIQMKFMGDVPSGEGVVQGLRAHIETVAVFGSAVEVNL